MIQIFTIWWIKYNQCWEPDGRKTATKLLCSCSLWSKPFNLTPAHHATVATQQLFSPTFNSPYICQWHKFKVVQKLFWYRMSIHNQTTQYLIPQERLFIIPSPTKLRHSQNVYQWNQTLNHKERLNAFKTEITQSNKEINFW